MAVNPTKLLPPSGGALAVRSKTIDIGKKKDGGIEGQVLVIRTQVIKIEKLITRGYTLKLKEQKEERKENEDKKRAKKEEDLETKKPPKEGKGKIPSLPRLGFLDRIRKFIGNMLLAYFAVRLIDHLPKLIPFVKAVGNVAEFLIDVGGGILNGLVSFIDWGYKAYDATRGFIKNLGGENFAKVFDGFNGAIGTLVETAITAAIVLASQGEGGVLDVGKDIIKDKLLGQGAKAAGQKVAGQAAGQAARTAGMGAGAVAGIVAGAGLLASALGEGAFQVRKVAVKPIQNLENEFNKDRNPITKIGRGIILTMVRPLYGLFSTVGFLLDVVGAPFRYAIELLRYPFLSEEDKIKQANNLAKFDARIREDLRKAMNMLTLGLAFKEKGSFGNIYGNKGSQKEMMNKMAGGGIARGGKRMGAIRRTGGVSGKGKIKRKTRLAQKPREVEFKSPGADIGGEDKLFGIFPKPKIPDAVNPFKAIENTGKTLGKSDYFGPILAITSKITLGQKPSEQDYKNVGLGINLLFNEGMNKGQLVGGVAAAYAEGGFVDKKTLEAVAEGGDITNWVAGAFKDATETNAQKTLREIRENAKKKKGETTSVGSDPTLPVDDTVPSGATPGQWGPLLDLIAGKESGGNYEAMYPSTTLKGATKMTIAEVARRATGAVGKYQQLPQYLLSRAKAAGLNPDKDLYSPENQDLIITKVNIEGNRGGRRWLKGEISDEQFMQGLSQEFASLPNARGEFHYPGQRSSMTPQKVKEALSKVKRGGYSQQELGKRSPGSSAKQPPGGRVVTSEMGLRNLALSPGMHMGVDISGNTGEHLKAFTDGTVEDVGSDGGYGNYVNWIDSSGVAHFYAHMNKPAFVKKGQKIKAGTVLGELGSTGRSSGPHLHWESARNPRDTGMPKNAVLSRFNPLSRYSKESPFSGKASAFHGENFGVVPKDGFTLKLHKGEMYKVIDKDSVDLLGFDLTKEIIDIENKSQLIAKAPSIIEKLKAISGYASYESEAPQTVIIQDTPEQDSYQDPMIAVIGGVGGGGDSYDPFAMLDRLSG